MDTKLTDTIFLEKSEIKIYKRETKTLSGHDYSVLSVAVTPDSQYIISGSEDATIKI